MEFETLPEAFVDGEIDLDKLDDKLRDLKGCPEHAETVIVMEQLFRMLSCLHQDIPRDDDYSLSVFRDRLMTVNDIYDPAEIDGASARVRAEETSSIFGEFRQI